jgi:hypothetical protein
MDLKPQTFSGSQNLYLIFAQRGMEELAVSIQYMIMNTGLGILAVRFVCRSPQANPKVEGGALEPFSHFSPREWGEFKDEEGKDFFGLRLNRIPVPVFFPAPQPLQFLQMCDKNLVWEFLVDWLVEQAKQDGFKAFDPGLDLKSTVRSLVEGTLGDFDDSQYKLVLSFPELKTSTTEEGV